MKGKIILFMILAILLSNINTLEEPFYSIAIENQDNDTNLIKEIKSKFGEIILFDKEIHVVITKKQLTEINEKYKIKILEESNKTVPGYKNLQRVESVLKEINLKFPKITKLIDLSKEFLNGRRTVHNNTIYCLKISSDSSIEQDKPNILMVIIFII
jgi:hypothetical protein